MRRPWGNSNTTNSKSLAHYQALYNVCANNARSNYTTIIEAKKRSTSTVSEMMINQAKKYLRKSQSDMHHIRSEANRYGLSIVASEYEFMVF